MPRKTMNRQRREQVGVDDRAAEVGHEPHRRGHHLIVAAELGQPIGVGAECRPAIVIGQRRDAHAAFHQRLGVGEIVRRAYRAAAEIDQPFGLGIVEGVRIVVKNDRLAVAEQRGCTSRMEIDSTSDNRPGGCLVRVVVVAQAHRLRPAGRGEDVAGFEFRAAIERDFFHPVALDGDPGHRRAAATRRPIP